MALIGNSKMIFLDEPSSGMVFLYNKFYYFNFL